jgi:hypothetical protein
MIPYAVPGRDVAGFLLESIGTTDLKLCDAAQEIAPHQAGRRESGNPGVG